jgi:hypothetical protein
MRKLFYIIAMLVGVTAGAFAQDFNQLNSDDTFAPVTNKRITSDSIQSQHKEIPRGVKMWTVDELFGDREEAEPDTAGYMFMNTIFTTGLMGEYNSLGNLGSPRISRIFADRYEEDNYMFLRPYDFFVEGVEDYKFTNTYSPITVIDYNTCGNRTNGEDHFKALFAVNAGKRWGFGFKTNYLYGRGYYSYQNTSLFNFSLHGTYTGDRYQATLLFQTNQQKVAENGGITNDNYVSHPEMYNETYETSEIPTVLQKNWNRNNHSHIFFNHRYSVGFNRKVPMTEDEIRAKKFAIESQKEQAARDAKDRARRRAIRQGEEFDEEEYDKRQVMAGRPDDARVAGDDPGGVAPAPGGRITVEGKAAADSLLRADAKAKADADTTWMKNEYVPVTSFIHTAKFDTYKRIYQSYYTPKDYYLNTFESASKYSGDSIYDKTRHYEFSNTFAIALLEGFNKWVKSGLKIYATYLVTQTQLPNEDLTFDKYNENSLSIGGQLSKKEGEVFHYNVTGEVAVAGDYAGEVFVDGDADVNFRLLGDTVTLEAGGFFHHYGPPFHMYTYHSKHFSWDNDFDNITHTRLQGALSLERTGTDLRVVVDNIKNYTYLSQTYNITENYGRTGVDVTPLQCSDPISILTVQLGQKLRWKIINWETQLTYQTSSKQDVIAVPDLNIYTNLFLRFKIAKVLDCDLGADLRWFTKYYAPDYSPALGLFTVQGNEDNRVKIGGYPWINVYANFRLQHTRFFVMVSHINSSDGNRFLVPHYPTNERLLRFGLSWNFFN